MSFEHLKLLYVEDELILRHNARKALTGVGWEMLEAADSDEAMRILGMDPGIDLLFTDVRLPGPLDGIELAEYARSLHPRIPVLVTSGFVLDLHMRLSALSEPVGFISKPYGMEEVLSAIHGFFGTNFNENTHFLKTAITRISQLRTQ